MELHCNGKKNQSQINPIFLDRTDFFFIKETGLVLPFSICGSHMSWYEWFFVPQIEILGFLEIFAIVNPIVN